MVFSSSTFIFIFLPFILIVYYCSPRKIRNAILFIGSLIFYSWGEPIYIIIMIFSTIFDYINGILIFQYKENRQHKKAKIILINSILVNLGILCFFKYSNFFIYNFNNIFNINVELLDITLPIGISFYTFQTMSYVIDVYQNTIKPQKNIIDFGTYVTFFPQLVAGPIVKYRDISDQLKSRKENINNFSYGVKRLIIGLFKKVVLANNIGILWTQISNEAVDTLPMLNAWLGAICFTFQIYFDFSGYSDMAIGLGKMFGFHFPENFDSPYTSKSISEFWRRWHISLGTWFKEYLYIPLGGSKKGKSKLIRNLLIVWMLTGFWHGASWNFIIWGLYFGIILVVEKLVLLKYIEKVPKTIQHIYTMVLVVISWVIFAFEDLNKIFAYLKAMFGFNMVGFFNNELIYIISTHFVLLILCILGSKNLFNSFCFNSKKIEAVLNIGYIFTFFISICFLVSSTYNPFLYFRF